MRFASADLSRHFADGSTLVAPSRLLASFISHQYAASQLAKGRQSWERPVVQGLDAWLVSIWREARYVSSGTPLLLSLSQEQLLWRRLFESHHPELFDASNAARLAILATRRLAEWQISTEGNGWDFDRDGEYFRKLLDAFRRSCRDEGWITRSELWAMVPDWIEQGFCRPGKTVFFGFEGRSPALTSLLNALGPEGKFDSIRTQQSKKKLGVKICSDLEDEIEYACRWARGRFEEQTGRSILLLVPGLADHRDMVERTLNHIFYSSWGLLGRNGQRNVDEDQCVFHIGAPKPLASHLVVAHAQLLLRLSEPRVAIADASAILRSPYLAGAFAEQSARALADLELRRSKELDVTVWSIEAASRNCPLMIPMWAKLSELLRTIPRRQELSAWGKVFGDILGVTGWPGESALTASEQEAVEAWTEALSELASLQLVAGPVSLHDALSQLNAILTGMSSPERGSWWSPIQVLDPKDAHSIEFDAAIVTGLSEATWPPDERTWPFVPFAVQRANNVPESSPLLLRLERERKTQALFQVAPILAGTCSERLAPIVRTFARVVSPSEAIWEGKLPASTLVYESLESVEDSDAPAFASSETAYGGVGIIKAQSLCPFKSFAENRLRASRPEDACFGFDARDRGSFLHAALADVWQSLGTLESLRSLTSDELGRLVQEAVDRAVTKDRSSPLHQLATQTEREGLVELIGEWLEIEKRRKQPFTVEQIEAKQSFEISGLHLSLRVDRIDRLPNGNVILIDYKSGEQKPANLVGPRPSEPQLLVYAAAVQDHVDAVLFAQMKPRDLKAVGWSREIQFPPPSPRAKSTVRKDWDTYLEDSRSAVETLASDFMRGSAVVDPSPGACAYCNQKPFCRIQERESSAEDSGDDE